MTDALWAAALAAAVLWPGRALGLVDGAPLDGRVEAVLVGLVLPALWMVDRAFLRRPLPRILVVVVLAAKVLGSLAVTEQGLCARFSTDAPFSAEVLTMPIEEPAGGLRSWDLRADWRSPSPACTAIVSRPYETAAAFPAWFVNLTDFVQPTRRLALEVSGFVSVPAPGRFSIEVGPDMTVDARIGPTVVSSRDGSDLGAPLDAGVHEVSVRARLTGDRWRFVPRWNGQSAFQAATLSIGRPGALEPWIARVISVVCTLLVVVLAGWWALAVAWHERSSPMLLAWCAASACLFAVMGATGRFERLTGLLVAAGALVPVARDRQGLRSAFLIVGVPWLAFFAARSLPLVGHFTAYSNDDWLAYQAAGYRIFMNGFWLEAGSKAFDYQPLYRWVSGFLHLWFGDSSVGETYWDAACLLAGALAAFAIVCRRAGFRWGLLAAAATLSTFTLGTIWYFVGRGLSEVAAAGWGFFAAFFLLRAARSGRLLPAAAAGGFAVLMFYGRLNHLLFAVVLAALLLPMDGEDWAALAREVPRIAGPALVYGVVLAAGVALFALRTWWYTGVFSVLYGTSLTNNDTGLRPATIGSAAVWGRVSHSLAALVWMNEPPRFDPRALAVAAGVLLSIAALVPLRPFARLPRPLALVTLGAMASALVAHTHNYPGRMSIHLVPFAAAITTIAVAQIVGRLLHAGAAAPPGRQVAV